MAMSEVWTRVGAQAHTVRVLIRLATVDAKQVPCQTLLEAARGLGKKTGLVATSRVTDATPASFSAHVSSRSMEDTIAEQQVRARWLFLPRE
jgi:alkaline phosphatase